MSGARATLSSAFRRSLSDFPKGSGFKQLQLAEFFPQRDGASITRGEVGEGQGKTSVAAAFCYVLLAYCRRFAPRKRISPMRTQSRPLGDWPGLLLAPRERVRAFPLCGRRAAGCRGPGRLSKSIAGTVYMYTSLDAGCQEEIQPLTGGIVDSDSCPAAGAGKSAGRLGQI